MATIIGLGSKSAWLRVYTCNRPPLLEYEVLQELRPAFAGEIPAIIKATGNHWRKVFSLYAKFCIAVDPENAANSGYKTWQEFRDSGLLTHSMPHALLFSEPMLGFVPESLSEPELNPEPKENSTVHIIMGKTYADRLGLLSACHWIDPYFAVNAEQRLIISPYFDYRQLSNIKLAQLTELVKGMAAK